MKKGRRLLPVVVFVAICAGVAPHAIGDGVAAQNKPPLLAGTAGVLTDWWQSIVRMLGVDASHETARASETSQATSPPAPAPSDPPPVSNDDDGIAMQTDPVDSGGDVGPGWDPDG